MAGESIKLTAHASASSHSAKRTARALTCVAARADEQAVSTLQHGPMSPSTNETRPAATEMVPPVAAYTLVEPRNSSAKSLFMMPRKTPTSHPRRVAFLKPASAHVV
eukprot:6524954-Prymnesium_polylepis.2